MNRRQEIPEESELVLCTVTKIYPHSVFVNIDDYGNKQGMIHISEISPGRIRNIHDYVRLGKKIICKVLKINHERGHIDLSLRRVSEGQKKEKAEIIKKQQKAKKIIEFVADQLKIDKNKLEDDLASKTEEEYDTLHDVFEDFIVDESALTRLKLDKRTYDKLAEVIRIRIKPPEVEIEGEVKLKSYSAGGVDIIKSILASPGSQEEVKIKYKGGGAYSISVTCDNYKDAEKILEGVTQTIEQQAKKTGCEYAFQRVEKKQKKAAA